MSAFLSSLPVGPPPIGVTSAFPGGFAEDFATSFAFALEEASVAHEGPGSSFSYADFNADPGVVQPAGAQFGLSQPLLPHSIDAPERAPFGVGVASQRSRIEVGGAYSDLERVAEPSPLFAAMFEAEKYPSIDAQERPIRDVRAETPPGDVRRIPISERLYLPPGAPATGAYSGLAGGTLDLS